MKAMRHIGIVVNNIDEALYFYRDILGLKIKREMTEFGKYIDDLFCLTEVRVKTVKMSADDGGLVELLHYESEHQKPIHRDICDRGYSHISFTVVDLDHAYKRLKEKGVKFNCAPQVSPDGNVKVTFCCDPEGNFIELVEELKIANYIDVVYNEKVRPYTEYPSQLCKYLFDRFRMKRGSNLLDVGCGRGDFLKGFKDLGLDVCGLDYEKSSSVISKDIEIRRADIETEPFPFDAESFDIVFSKSAIEHLLNPENFMKECYRLLRLGGRIIIMTPDWISQMKIFFDDYTHRHPYTVSAVKDILDIYKFKKTESELFYQLPILWRYPALKIVSSLLRLFVPVTARLNIKFVRWSSELMILGTGIKEENG